jgi:hypothetical protein
MFVEVYRSAEAAFAALDFTGRGYILKSDIVNSYLCQRLEQQYGVSSELIKIVLDENPI